MRRRWELRMVAQEGYEENDFQYFTRHIGLADFRPVTLELWCDGERVFAFHSPHLRDEQGSMYFMKMVEGRVPWDLFNEDMAEHGPPTTYPPPV